MIEKTAATHVCIHAMQYKESRNGIMNIVFLLNISGLWWRMKFPDAFGMITNYTG